MSTVQKPIPHLHEIEQGRDLIPDYGGPARARAITTSEWQHMVPCRFGEARSCSWLATTKWTEDSHRYDIFESPMLNCIALRWWNGSGEGWLIVNERHLDRGDGSLLRHIARIETETNRWDLCHQLWGAACKSHAAGETKGRQVYEQAFLDGRLKKRRRQGRVSVELKPVYLKPVY